jgi:hypothetical protein
VLDELLFGLLKALGFTLTGLGERPLRGVELVGVLRGRLVGNVTSDRAGLRGRRLLLLSFKW